MAVLALAYGVHLVLTWALEHTDDLYGDSTGVRFGVLIALLLAYSVLLAVPFVPGIEVGLALLAMEGAWIAPFVYFGTVTGLVLAYLAGTHMPYRYLHRVFADLGLGRACALLERLEPLSEAERLALLRRQLPARIGKVALGWRYLLLAVLFNVPGNAFLGGGGGIALAAGFSRLFGHRLTILTIMLAVAPVPLLVWAFGMRALI
jgi:hypothetical protein